MAEQELEITIEPNGQVTVRTIGIKGPACMDWADLMAQIIGREESRETTAEYYETPVQVDTRVRTRQQR